MQGSEGLKNRAHEFGELSLAEPEDTHMIAERGLRILDIGR